MQSVVKKNKKMLVTLLHYSEGILVWLAGRRIAASLVCAGK
jgi:hypothetical protein